MTEEHAIQNKIRRVLADSCVLFRVNVVSGVSKSGNYVTSGVPKGYSDLSGHRKSDGRAVYIEVKTPDGKPTAEQVNFINQMKKTGAIAGICRSPEEAIELIKE